MSLTSFMASQLQNSPSLPCFDTGHTTGSCPLPGDLTLCLVKRGHWWDCKARAKRRVFFLPLMCCFLWQVADCPMGAVLSHLSSPHSLSPAHALHDSTPARALWQVSLPQVGCLFLWQPNLSSKVAISAGWEGALLNF